MWRIDSLIDWARGLCRSALRALRPRRPTDSFTSIVCEGAPGPDTVGSGVVHIVHVNGKHRWAMLRCPCGCGDVITLSLQPIHNPHWRVVGNSPEEPGLHPSIWRKNGCHSHFWIAKGQVHWA